MASPARQQKEGPGSVVSVGDKGLGVVDSKFETQKWQNVCPAIANLGVFEAKFWPMSFLATTKRLLTPFDHDATPELHIHQPTHTRSIAHGTYPTNTTTQDSSKRTALVVDSSESDHTDDEGRPKDIPRQSKRLCRAGNPPDVMLIHTAYDGLLQANSHVASVLEVPHEEYDPPANGRVGRQGTTSGSVPDHRCMQGPEYEAENHLESDRSSSTTTEAPRKSGNPAYEGVIMRPSSNADGAEVLDIYKKGTNTNLRPKISGQAGQTYEGASGGLRLDKRFGEPGGGQS
ncbi:hypothetical protein BU15DRAFT_62703 [Melanogaster broomeanus]|nr:hypothetical protein BU15DRAFT_62703 [Melanogaster broomeanus]